MEPEVAFFCIVDGQPVVNAAAVWQTDAEVPFDCGVQFINFCIICAAKGFRHPRGRRGSGACSSTARNFSSIPSTIANTSLFLDDYPVVPPVRNN